MGGERYINTEKQNAVFLYYISYELFIFADKSRQTNDMKHIKAIFSIILSVLIWLSCFSSAFGQPTASDALVAHAKGNQVAFDMASAGVSQPVGASTRHGCGIGGPCVLLTICRSVPNWDE